MQDSLWLARVRRGTRTFPRLHVLHLKAVVLLSVLGGCGCLGRLPFLVFDPSVVNGSAKDDCDGGSSSANAPDQVRLKLSGTNDRLTW